MGVNELITIERTFNAELAIYFINELWEVVTEDGATDSKPEMFNEVWLKASVNGEIACLFRVHLHYVSTWEIHILCLPEHRKYSRKIAKECIKWVFENIPLCDRLETVVPVIYPAVINFVNKVGFVQEGLKRSCFLKHGELVDLAIFGIVKNDQEELSCQQ